MAAGGHRKKAKAPSVVVSPEAKKTGLWFESLEERLTLARFFLIAVFASVLYTWPLIINLGSQVLGVFNDYYGDVFLGIWELWITQYELLKLGSNPLMIEMLSGPYASFFYSALAFHKYLLVMVPLTRFLGPVVSFNLFTLGNFVLGAVCTYLLVRELTGARVASAVAAFAFAFCPYAYAHSVVHMDLGATWPMPLLFWALLRLDRERRLGNWLLVAAVLVLFHSYCSIYYYLFIPLAGISYMLVRLADSFFYDFKSGKKVSGAFARVSRSTWILVGVAAILLVVGGILVYKYYLGPLATMQVRPIHWQERFKLSWANYLLPGVDHPWFGQITAAVVPIRRNVTESTAYIGWLPILLALYSLKVARRDWRAFMFLVFGLSSLLFTLGPYIRLGYLNIPMPSILLHSIAPFIRVISRYSIFLQLSVAVFAGYGMFALLRRHKNKAGWILAVSLGLLAVEFMRPSGMTAVASDTKQAPPIYAYLARLDEDVTVFEYPPTAATGVPLDYYMYFQTIHRKRLFNRHFNTNKIPEKYLPLWQDLDYPGAICDPNNTALLRYFGVDYVAFHDRSSSPVSSFPTADLSRVQGIELVDNFGKDALYRVVAEPATVLLSFDTSPYYNYLETAQEIGSKDFDPPIVLGAGADRLGWRIMRTRGRLTVRNLLDTPQKVELAARAVSFIKPRNLVIVANSGLNEQIAIGTGPQDIRFGPLDLPANGEIEVVFHSPEGVSELPTNAGKIRASIALARMAVIRVE